MNVSVYPVDHPDQATEGVMLILSRNGLSCSVGFHDKPPWTDLARDGALFTMSGPVLLLMRDSVDAAWKDIVSEGEFIIEQKDPE